MKTKIKICGLRTVNDVNAVNKALPEFAGFIFVPDRVRYITPEEAEELRQKLDSSIIPVGVFQNADIKMAADYVNRCKVKIIQLHGKESNCYIKELRSEIAPDIKIIKAFKIESSDDIMKAYASAADFVLLDNGNGGTGEAFDWNLIKRIGRDFFLAGGLDAANVAQAIRLTHPYAVDVSSGVETDGKKDPKKIEAFVSAVRAADCQAC